MTAIPGFKLTFWKRRNGTGGMVPAADADDASIAILRLPTLPDGAAAFDLPEHRDVLDSFLDGVGHGFIIGTDAARDLARRKLGVTILTRWPGRQQVRHDK